MDILDKKYGPKSAFLLLALITYIIFFVFNDYLLFRKLYLFKDIASDSINLFYPLWINAADYLRTDGIPMWSFRQGMGQNIFPFRLGNPFNLILYALGKDHLAFGIVYVEAIKIISGGMLFYAYLRTVSLSYYAAIIGGLSYSFSGFMILGGQWSIFSIEAVYMALLLLSFELYFLKKNWILFPVAIALICAFQPFDLYLYSIVLLFYIPFRFISKHGLRLGALSLLFLKLVILSMIGLGMSTVFFVANIIELLESPRVAGASGYFNELFSASWLGLESQLHYVTAIMRFYSNDLMGTGSDFKGWKNYLAAPLFYCGLMSLLLAPQIFIFLNRRKSILYSLLILTAITTVTFPFFRYLFWAFTGDYYRLLSLIISLVVLLMGLSALSFIDKTNRINRTLLLLTSLVLIIALLFPYFQHNDPIDIGLAKIAAVFIMAYTVLIFFMTKRKYKHYIYIVLAFLSCCEFIYFSAITVNKRPVISAEEYRARVGYNDYTIEALKYLREIDDTFYRVEKNYASGPAMYESSNDGQVQGYNGTSSYYSFNQPNYIRFLTAMEIVQEDSDLQTRWALGLSSRYSLMTFASVKYLLAKDSDQQRISETFYENISTFNDVVVYKNRFYLPLGFTYDRYISLGDFQTLTLKQKGVALLGAFVAEDLNENLRNNFTVYSPKDDSQTYGLEQYNADIKERTQHILKLSRHENNYFMGTINLDKKKMLFLSIPYDPGWRATVDGKETSISRTNIGFMGIVLGKGNHTVELIFRPRYLLPSAAVTVVYLLIFITLVWSSYRKRPGAVYRFNKFLEQPGMDV